MPRSSKDAGSRIQSSGRVFSYFVNQVASTTILVAMVPKVVEARKAVRIPYLISLGPKM